MHFEQRPRSTAGPLRVGRAGAFAQALLIVHGLSFLGNVYYVLPRSVQLNFPYLSGFVPSDRPYPGWTETFLADVGDSTAGWGGIVLMAVLLATAARLRQSVRWAYAGGVAFVGLTLFWMSLAVSAARGVASDAAMVAFYVAVAAGPCAVGAAGSFVHAARLRKGPASAPEFDVSPALPSERAWARAFDVVIVGLAFVTQTVLTDALGGIGSAGWSSERWVSSLRWLAVFLAEVACVVLVAPRPRRGIEGRCDPADLEGLTRQAQCGQRLACPAASIRAAVRACATGS